MKMDAEFNEALAADQDFFDWTLGGDERFFLTSELDGAAFRRVAPDRCYEPKLRSAS